MPASTSPCPNRLNKSTDIVCGVSDEELKKVNRTTHKFHGDWNDTIKPQKKLKKFGEVVFLRCHCSGDGVC
jgi:hypothetical protein